MLIFLYSVICSSNPKNSVSNLFALREAIGFLTNSKDESDKNF